MCCAAAAPPQDGHTALMEAAYYGKLDCLEHLVAKGANLKAKNKVSAAPPAAPPAPALALRPRRPPPLLPRPRCRR